MYIIHLRDCWREHPPANIQCREVSSSPSENACALKASLGRCLDFCMFFCRSQRLYGYLTITTFNSPVFHNTNPTI